GYGGDEAEVVEGRRANGAEDLACLADGAPQKLARLSDLNVVDAGALQLRVGGHEDRCESVVQVARKTTPMFFVLGEKLSGEVLKVAIQLHPLHREGRLVAEDAKKGDRVVAGVALAVHVQHALGFGGHEQGDADRERDILCIGGAELLLSGALDDEWRAALERLPRDRRPGGHPCPDQTPRAGWAEEERVAHRAAGPGYGGR